MLSFISDLFEVINKELWWKLWSDIWITVSTTDLPQKQEFVYQDAVSKASCYNLVQFTSFSRSVTRGFSIGEIIVVGAAVISYTTH